MTHQLNITHEDRLIAWFAGIAVCIHLLESAFPSPLPGIKPGLANAITLIVLLRYGFKMAIWVSLLRVLVGSLLFGTFLTPAFMLSASGAVSSLIAMGLLYSVHQPMTRLLKQPLFGALSFSLLGSMAHMLGQIVCAWAVLIMHDGILRLTPILLTAALIFGTVTGLVASAVLKHLPPVKQAK